MPNGWQVKTMGAVLEKVADSVQVDPKKMYQEIGIRSHGKGIFHKEPILGSALGDKRVFWVQPDAFVVNIVFAWEQAVACTTSREQGMIASHRFPMFRPKDGLCDINYLVNFFRTKKGTALLELASPGGAGRNKTLGQKEFLDISFNLPPYQEQIKIAEILLTWDKAIEVAEKLYGSSKAQKKTIMRHLLTGERRLPGYCGDWSLLPLSEFCEVRRGASPRPIQDSKWFSESGRGWVRISDVTKSKTPYLEKTTQYLSSLGVEKSVPVDPGELIMSICATIGVPKIVGIPVCIHDGFVVFRNCKKNLSLHFLYHYLSYVSDELKSGGQPGTQKNLNTSIVAEIKIPCISKEEQEQIALVLSKANDEIRVLEKQLLCLKAEKQALMQQLLTGKRRVKVVDSSTDKAGLEGKT